MHIAEVAIKMWTLAITLFSGFLSLDLHIDNDIVKPIGILVYWCTAIDQMTKCSACQKIWYIGALV